MTFFERVDGLCKQRGISPTKLVVALGHSKSITAAWKSPDCKIRPGTIKGVADYFGITIDELMKDVDEPIDYENVNTDEFFQPRWQEFLKANGYNEKKAIRAYFAFEKAQAQDALSEQSSVIQNYANNIHNSNVVQGDNISSTNQTEKTLTDNEKELLRIFSELSLIEQSKVIVYAAELKEKK